MIKKPDGSYRICIDYRKLNAVTVKDRYPLPNPNMIFDKLAGCSFFSKLDLRWAYWQIRVAEEDVEKTAFRTPLGSYAFRVMGMGLANAAPTFQRLIDTVFRDLDFVSAYLDDIMIASRTAEEHLVHIALVLQRLAEHGLIARESKCVFFANQIKFLGYVFSTSGRTVDTNKVDSIRAIPAPATVYDLQRWLGAVNYYSMFIPEYARRTAPLSDLLKATPEKVKKKSRSKIAWGPDHQQAFDDIRQALAAPPVLRLFDPALPCIVSADASAVAVGGVLEQVENGVRRPVAYYSRKLTPAETRYTTRERECLAIKQCLVTWRHYLLGSPFTVRSDHESLKWLQTQKVDTLSDRLLRWLEYFSLFDFKHEYLPGELNVLPDQLSRPETHVLLVQGSQSTPYDLVDMADLFDKHQAISVSTSAEPALSVVLDHEVHSTFEQDLRDAQATDPHLQEVLRHFRDGPPENSQFRTLYVVHDGLVVVEEPDGRKRVVVPDHKALRKRICKYFHDEAGHPGVHRTLHAVATHFFWPNMSRFVQSYVVSCGSCQAAKASTRRPAGHSEPHHIPAQPASEWSVDFLELPRSANGYTSLLVFTERVSKLVILVPMVSNPDAALTAQVVAKAFIDHVFCWFGLPDTILSDRGPQFRAAVWHNIWRLLGTTVKHSTPHTPHSHGDVERQNRIINEMLRTMFQSTHFKDLLPCWDEHVALIQFAMNNAVVGRTGMTPLFFFSGRHPRVPATLGAPSELQDVTSWEFVQAIQNRLQQARDAGRLGQIRMIERMDRRRDSKVQYTVGGWAWLRSDECPIPGDKHFKLPWTGPFQIVALSPSTATLDLPEHWRLQANVFHFNKLKPFVPRDPMLGSQAGDPAPAGSRRASPSTPVVGIEAHRCAGRRGADGGRPLQYWVRYQGYPQAFNEWKSAQWLVDAGHQDLLSPYHRLHSLPVL
mmetsp:Transcript_5617/g.17995  ORF Transcript_5617/g.17995 Transcript_5617/m.17995 type:complete len:941 (-) Transcript_5617:11-2833(-)